MLSYYFSTHGAGGFFFTVLVPDDEGLSAFEILPVLRNACILLLSENFKTIVQLYCSLTIKSGKIKLSKLSVSMSNVFFFLEFMA